MSYKRGLTEQTLSAAGRTQDQRLFFQRKNKTSFRFRGKGGGYCFLFCQGGALPSFLVLHFEEESVPEKMLCRMVLVHRKKKIGTVPVYLNVYDLTPINGYAYWLGLGVYHSGVQVHGVEYAFGAHDHSTTGIFEVEPKQCPGFTFRKSILIGRTDLGPKEVRAFMEKLAVEYSGNTYHLITKNCNHFCNDVCHRLTGKPIPRWVNRLARLGFFCNCVLPAGLNETKVRQVRSSGGVYEGDKKKLRSHSSRYPSTNPPTHSLSTCPSGSTVKRSRQKRCVPPSSSLIHSSSTSALSLKL